MQLLDSIKCVECGKVEYRRSAGKSSRSFYGVCDEHQGELFNASSKDVSTGKPEVVPAVSGNKGR